MKRILSLDGGGVRGMFSLQILLRLEELFREETGRHDLVLADVFDLIAGTSTGAIIAAFLAWGKSVAEIEKMYTEHGHEIFCRQNLFRRWKCRYRADRITRFFRQEFCEDDGSAALLGSKKLRTLLLIVMRNASTGSPWPLSSNPAARYNDPGLDDCNLNIPLWQLLRASTAAPIFFPPEEILFGKQKFMFVDGGVTPFNNPALIAVMMATLPPYRLCWPAGREKLHVVSVGTGSFRSHLPDKAAKKIWWLDQLRFVIPALIGSSSVQQDLLCRVLGDCVFGASLDSEIGDLGLPTLLDPSQQKFTYVRYNESLDTLPKDVVGPAPLKTDMDNLSLISTLQRIGQQYARDNVHLEHLRPRDESASKSAV